jgi:hypothetical protein
MPSARADAPALSPVPRMPLPPRPRAVRPIGSRAARPALSEPAAPNAAAGVVAASHDVALRAVDPDDVSAERPSVAADAETVLPPRARLVPPPLPVQGGVQAMAEAGDTLDADDDLEADDDETPTASNIALPEVMFSRRSYGPVVDLSRPTVTDLDQPPLPMAIVPRQPALLARRAPIVLRADPSDSLLTRQLARRPVSASMPLALMKPHVRIAKSLARDVRASKREIVIGLSIGLTLAAPLFIAGHLYLQRSGRLAATTQPALTAHARARAPQPVAERAHTPPVPAPERIQRAVAGLEPAPLPRLTSTPERAVPEALLPDAISPEAVSPGAVSPEPLPGARAASVLPPARALSATTRAAKAPPRRRPKQSPPPVPPRPAASALSVQSVADVEEPELSPAERAGLSTTIPF